MKTLTVALPGREYNIQIGWGLLTRAGEELRAVLPGASRIFVVTDSHVAPLYLERVRASLEGAGFRVTAHTVPAGEGSKCPARLAELWEAMMDAGLTRTDAVAALGGGGAFAYIKFIKPKQGAKVSADPDDYEFEDEEYENEDVPEQGEQEDQN